MRRARVEITIREKNVTKDMFPFLLSLSYTDNGDDGLDDLQIVLEDRDALWQGDWLPQKGDRVEATIIVENWRAGETQEKLFCGVFEIDEIELETGDGDRVTLKAVPAAVNSSLTYQKKTRAWENVSIVTVVADIAQEAGLDTLYRGPEIVFQRVEQRQQSDLEFLKSTGEVQGLRVVLKKNRLIMYAGQYGDGLEPIEVKRGVTEPGHLFRFKTSTAGIYTQCVVGFTKSDDSETIENDYKPDIPPTTGRTLYLNKRIESSEQGERVAKAELRDKNRKEKTGSTSGMGEPRYIAGVVLDCKGWHAFDGKYVIAKATHSLSKDSGYTTSTELETALDY